MQFPIDSLCLDSLSSASMWEYNKGQIKGKQIAPQSISYIGCVSYYRLNSSLMLT